MTKEEYAEWLQGIAMQFVARVHDEDPRANARWLFAALPAEADRFALLFVLAAAIPAEEPWSKLLAWCAPPT